MGIDQELVDKLPADYEKPKDIRGENSLFEAADPRRWWSERYCAIRFAVYPLRFEVLKRREHSVR